jgi:hypothetical protein
MCPRIPAVGLKMERNCDRSKKRSIRKTFAPALPTPGEMNVLRLGDDRPLAARKEHEGPLKVQAAGAPHDEKLSPPFVKMREKMAEHTGSMSPKLSKTDFPVISGVNQISFEGNPAYETDSKPPIKGESAS